MIQDFVAEQQRRLQERIQQQSEAIVDGAFADYAKYREACGVIRGLRMAERELAELVEAVRKHNDTDF